MSRRNVLASLSLLVGLAAACADADQDALEGDLTNGDTSSEEAPIAAQVLSGNAVIDVANVTAIGSGCAPGTWSATKNGFDPDGNVMYNVQFRDYRIGSDLRFQTKNCKLSVYLNVKPGYKGGIAGAEVVVSGRLGAGQTARTVTSIGFPGTGQAPIEIPWLATGATPGTEAVTRRIPISRAYPLLGGRCVQRELVEINTTTELDNPQGTFGFVALTEINGAVGLRFSVSALPCG